MRKSTYKFNDKVNIYPTWRSLMLADAGAPARLRLPRNRGDIVKLPVSPKPPRVDRGLKTAAFHACIQHTSPTFNPDQLDFFSHARGFAGIIDNGLKLLLVVNMPGQPLVLSPFTLGDAIIRKTKWTGQMSDSENIGLAIAGAITQQEHGIPQTSSHYRVIRKSLGEFSLGIMHEGMCIPRKLLDIAVVPLADISYQWMHGSHQVT
jgi:hypothetical protein